MAKLTARARKAIPTQSFALPGRRYPIEDANHARNALARVSQHGTAQEKATVRAKVHAKYPKIGEQHGPVDDMGNKPMTIKVEAHVRKAPKGYGGGDSGMKHHAQMGTLRALGGDCC